MQEPENTEPTPIDIFEDTNIQMPMEVRANLNTEVYSLLMKLRAKMGDIRERDSYVPTFTWRTIPLKEDNSNIIYVLTFEFLEALTLAIHVNQEVNGLEIALVPSKNDSIEVHADGTVTFHSRLKDSLALDRKELRPFVDLIIELLMDRGEEKAIIAFIHRRELYQWDGSYRFHDEILESFESENLTRTSIVSTKLGGEFSSNMRSLTVSGVTHCRFFMVTPFKGAATYILTVNEVSKIINVYRYETKAEAIGAASFFACGLDKMPGKNPNWIIDASMGGYLQAISNEIPELQEKIFEIGLKYLNVIDL